MAAAFSGNTGLLSALIRDPRVDVDAVDPCGHSALVLAAKNGQDETFQLIFNSQQSHDPSQLNRALVAAAAKGSASIVAT